MTRAQETKSFAAVATKILDADQGIVEHIVAVMGNIDRGDDVIHPGAFSKTIHERGLQVKVLDQHNTASVRNIVGKPRELREVGQGGLPSELKAKYPDATGALIARTQFLLDTDEGMGVFKRIKNGAVDQYSIGYDPIVTDFSTVGEGDDAKTVRNLREVRLWEYSAVIFAMNSATATLSAKDEGEPTEGKPWNIFEQDGQFCVYKVSTQSGKPDGETLGCHDTQEEALAQMRALYANEPEVGGKLDVLLTELKESDIQRIMDRFDRFEQLLSEARLPADEQNHDAPPDSEAADDTPTDDDAGPDIPPTAERLAAVEQLRQEFEQLEV